MQVKKGQPATQIIPSDHAKVLCKYYEADPETVAAAINGALAAKADWESLPWEDRAAIFLKAADLVSGKYRYKLMAATMLGQGKNIWQAEIDAAAEVRVAGELVRLAWMVVSWSAVDRLPAIWCEVCRAAVLDTAG